MVAIAGRENEALYLVVPERRYAGSMTLLPNGLKCIIVSEGLLSTVQKLVQSGNARYI